VTADIRGYLQILPLLAARDVLGGGLLMREDYLRIVGGVEGSLRASQVAELLSGVELLLGVVLSALRIVCSLQLLAA
jgi:hypothetical protein